MMPIQAGWNFRKGQVRFVIGPKDDTYLIVLGGNKGSRLFPKEITMRPAFGG
jgi:hypothetical protein